MILGECPYDDCKDFDMRGWPPEGSRLPAYARTTCKTCKRIVWVKYSYVDPVAYTEADFQAEFVIDEATKEITERKPPKSGTMDG